MYSFTEFKVKVKEKGSSSKFHKFDAGWGPGLLEMGVVSPPSFLPKVIGKKENNRHILDFSHVQSIDNSLLTLHKSLIESRQKLAAQRPKNACPSIDIFDII